MFSDNNILNYTSRSRQKIAQQTFDMVSGGSVYNPVVTNINTVNEVPTFAVGVGFTVPTHPSEYEINAIDMLYGSRISTQQQPLNTIDSLYRKGEEVQVIPRNCNRRDNKGIFKYSEIEIKTYIESTFINKDCSLFLFFETYNYNPQFGYSKISFPITIDISDCCKDFSKNMYCSKNDKELYNSYNIFGRCVKQKINYKINELKKHNPTIFDSVTPPYSIPLKSPMDQLKEQIKSLITDIVNGRNNFLNFSNFQKEALSGFNTDNQLSCICKEGGESVYCCNPDNDPKRCKCPDGTPKSLCSDNCYSELRVLVPQYFFGGKDVYEQIFKDNCWAYLDKANPNEKSAGYNVWKIYEANGTQKGKILKQSDIIWGIELPKVTDIEKQELLAKNIQSDQILKVLVPKDKIVIVVVEFYFPCGSCCWKLSPKNSNNWVIDKSKRRKIVREFVFDPSSVAPAQLNTFLFKDIENSTINKEELSILSKNCDVNCE